MDGMKQINFDNIETIEQGGGFKDLPAGAYVCAIVGAEDVEDKEYARLAVDIIEGEFKDYFSEKFYDDKPWAHSMVLSYKDGATIQGMLKGKLKVITECNPGFDAEAAWNGGDLSKFVGRAVGVVFREEEYEDRKTGEVKVGKARPDRFVSAEDVRAGKVKAPDVKTLRSGGGRKRGTATYADTMGAKPAGVYDGDIPFM